MVFDGKLIVSFSDVVLYGVFFYESVRQIFFDELGLEDGFVWKVFVEIVNFFYLV